MDPEELHKRFDYHPPTSERARFHEAIRDAAAEFAATIADLCPAGREQSLAITNVEQAMFWANAGIARG